MSKGLCVLVAICAVSLHAFGNYVVPNFIKLIEGVDGEIPLITGLIFNSYQYWWVLSLPPFLLLLVGYIKPETVNHKKYDRALFYILIFMVALAPLTIYACYLPIFELAGKDT